MLGDALKMIEDQTYNNIEVIIVNDGSTDETTKIMDTYKAQSRFSVECIHLPENSRNVTIPRNIGISHTNGAYIAHWDDDIFHLKDKILVLVEALAAQPAMMLAYGYRIHTPQNSQNRMIVGPPAFNPHEGWGMDTSQFIYRRAVYKMIEPVFCKRACDWELMKKIWTAFPNSFLETENIVSEYVWHGGNRSLDDRTKTATVDIEPFIKYFNTDKFNVENQVI
jgi:glycosyltransferase involved in cell wall biosynthesis